MPDHFLKFPQDVYKRQALTVDLLVQNLSPHSNRGSEGAVTTRLYTNMDGMKGSKDVYKRQVLARDRLPEASIVISFSEKPSKVSKRWIFRSGKAALIREENSPRKTPSSATFPGISN